MCKQIRRKGKNLISAILVLVICMTMLGSNNLAKASTTGDKALYHGEGIDVTFNVDSSWSGAFNATIVIKNVTEDVIDNWALAFYMPHEIINIWDGQLSYGEDHFYVIKNVGWNQDIEPGKTVQFGFTAKQQDKMELPKSYHMVMFKEEVNSENYTTSFSINSDWTSGFEGSITIKNKSNHTIEDWTIEFDYDKEISSIWNGEIISKEGEHYVIKNPSYNQNLQAGQSYTFGFIGSGSGNERKIENVKMYQVSCVQNLKGDIDGDLVSDVDEVMYGMNVTSKDTDGDGLPDDYELNKCGTSPLSQDTDENGILDINEDADGDGLTNLYEYQLGTNPMDLDTDNDKLLDYDEVNVYKTNPQYKDTDNDLLSDYDDIKLGFDPLKQDTDLDGIIDGNEQIQQQICKEIVQEELRAVTQVSVRMKTSGNIENVVSICNMYNIDQMSTGVVGLVGVPVEINSSAKFDEAIISFKYDKEALGETKEENLAIMWYDEENNWYKILDEESVLDKDNQTVSYATSHFSTYMLVDREIWYNTWKENLDYRSGDGTKKNYDFAFVVDVSGSMEGQRISTAQKTLTHFVDLLSGDDRGCLVQFASTAKLLNGFGGSSKDIKANINELKAYGGTNVNAGLLKAIEQFQDFEAANENIIILICDGDVNYKSSTIQSAINNNIQIYTINVGARTSDYYLKMMADKTGGEYYYCSSPREIETVFARIEDQTLENVDKTDSDGDGLYDIYETVGFRLANGRLIQTDPDSVDTDGDNLTDYDEIGFIYNLEIPSKENCFGRFPSLLSANPYIGKGETKTIKYVMLYSDPLRVDSDFDKKSDYEDKTPWSYDVDSIYIYKTNHQKGVDEYGDIADDMTSNDFSKKDLLDINGLMEIQIQQAHDDNGEYLFKIFKDMSTTLFATGEMEDVILDMIDHFQDGTGADYRNSMLTENVIDDISTIVYIHDIKEAVVSRLNKNGGNIYDLEYYEGAKDNNGTIQYYINENVDTPCFDRWANKFTGLTICINDTWANNVEIVDYEFDGEYFSGKLKFTIYDHFGLDLKDVQGKYGYLAGFRAWFVLQHYNYFDGKYQPFVDIVEFEVPFEGEVVRFENSK